MSRLFKIWKVCSYFLKIEDIFVRKESGKGLSSNDFTTAEKNKLAGIATGANAYTHPSSGVTAGTYRSVSVDTQGHVPLVLTRLLLLRMVLLMLKLQAVLSL